MLLIAKQFGFEGKGESAFDAYGNSSSVWIDQPRILSVTSYGSVSFSAALGEAKFGKSPSSVEEALALADKIVVDYDLSTASVGEKEATLVWVPGEGTRKEVTSWKKASFVEIAWEGKLGDYPLYQNGHQGKPLFIRLGKDGSLVHLEYLATEIEESADYALKSPREVGEALGAGMGELVLVEGPVSSVKVSRASFAYLQESGSAYLQPIFVFEGSTNLGKEAVIFLPALAGKHLQ
jgi:hypothetical protein